MTQSVEAQSSQASPHQEQPAALARHSLLVCTTCGSQWIDGKKTGISQGEQLLSALQSSPLDPQIQIKPVECMSGCSHACVVGLTAPHKTTYVFGDLKASEAELIVATAHLYLSRPDGILPWAERPLKKGVIARIPWTDC